MAIGSHAFGSQRQLIGVQIGRSEICVLSAPLFYSILILRSFLTLLLFDWVGISLHLFFVVFFFLHLVFLIFLSFASFVLRMLVYMLIVNMSLSYVWCFHLFPLPLFFFTSLLSLWMFCLEGLLALSEKPGIWRQLALYFILIKF